VQCAGGQGGEREALWDAKHVCAKVERGLFVFARPIT
jgi:hypothetical protein